MVETDLNKTAEANAAQRAEAKGFAWLHDFEARHGRPFRVLHIGNIANNAYNNAKIQRQFGIEADVVCYDYYHVMGCPEWEDANFSGTIANPTLPDWWAVDLRSFRRPRWFAQGPGTLCRSYLAARRGSIIAGVLWRILTMARWTFCRQSRFAGLVREAILRPCWRIFRVGLFIAHVATRACAFVRAKKAWDGQRVRPRQGSESSVDTSGSAAEVATAFPASSQARYEFDALCLRAAGAFGVYFPDRPDHLDAREIALYGEIRDAWMPLLTQYDMIQAYSTDPAIPLVCGLRNFAAYEHGTIRAIPFQDTVQGRMCALSYREAPAVFVTNSDNVAAAERLGISKERMFCLPHAFDDTKLRRFAEENRAICREDPPCVFFAPARLHWKDRDPSFAKGNDVFLRALPLVRRTSPTFRVVLVEWGRDVAVTKQLLADVGCEDVVTWIPLLKKRELWAQYLGSHAVVDQFVIPALGGVAFEAMALGRRTITALDIEQVTRFFGEAPPVFAAETVEQVAEAMLQIIADPKDEAGRGDASRCWIEGYHSARRIVEIQLDAYQSILLRKGVMLPAG